MTFLAIVALARLAQLINSRIPIPAPSNWILFAALPTTVSCSRTAHRFANPWRRLLMQPLPEDRQFRPRFVDRGAVETADDLRRRHRACGGAFAPGARQPDVRLPGDS